MRAAARGPEPLPDSPQPETRHSAIDDALSWEDPGAFIKIIDTIVRESFNSSEADAEVHEAAFEITWQLQQCIRDELDGNPDLGPVLTITGDSLHAWATSCHEYVQTTWKEAGELFLVDLEIFLGKTFATLGQHILNFLSFSFLCFISSSYYFLL